MFETLESRQLFSGALPLNGIDPSAVIQNMPSMETAQQVSTVDNASTATAGERVKFSLQHGNDTPPIS